MVESPLPMWRLGFDPWVGKIPWRREWHPTPVFLPGKSHGQGRLVGGATKESDMMEQLNHHHHSIFENDTFPLNGTNFYTKSHSSET